MRTFTQQKQVTAITRMYYNPGSTTGVYVSAGTTTGYLVPLSEESASLNGIQYGYGFKLITEVNEDVREGDKVTIGGTVYNVRGIVVHDRGFNVQYKRCILMRSEKQ